MTTDSASRPCFVSGADYVCVAAQLGRTPQAMSRVVARCRWGFPAAVENLPYDAGGRPFPTLYYATCPTLVAAVAAVESGGGVKRHEHGLQSDAAARTSLLGAVAAERRRRRMLVRRYGLPMLDDGVALTGGIGGVGDQLRLKCLHAHAAHALARPGYAFGRTILAEAGDLWCENGRCATTVPASS
ncbi:MAG: DUF501 domain-containing protein [Thermoleophilia bacterium]